MKSYGNPLEILWKILGSSQASPWLRDAGCVASLEAVAGVGGSLAGPATLAWPWLAWPAREPGPALEPGGAWPLKA